MFSRSILTFVIVLNALFATVPSAHAREDWYETKGAHVGYGLIGGIVIGSALTSHHYRSRERHCHQPVYYQPVPVYYQPAPVYHVPAGQQPYVNYRHKSAFPFYSKTEVEIIPQLSPVEPARTQAINNADYADKLRSVTPQRSLSVSSEAPREAELPVRNEPRQARERDVVTVSNRAGSVGAEPQAKTIPQAREANVVTVEATATKPETEQVKNTERGPENLLSMETSKDYAKRN